MLRLSQYPSPTVRVACDACRRLGVYRRARLTERYGAEVDLQDLLARLTATCEPRKMERRPCRAYFVEIGRPRTPRAKPGPVPTIGQLHQDPYWLWLNCGNWTCGRRVAATTAQFVIRWGADASSDVLRRSMRCAACGHKGGTLTTPSWSIHRDGGPGWAPFPVEKPSAREEPPHQSSNGGEDGESLE